MNKKRAHSKRSRGFTIVELLVATGMLAVVASFAAVLVSSVQDLLFQTGRQTRVDEVHSNLMMTLSNSGACMNTFSVLNYTGAPVVVTDIRSATNAPKFSTGNTYYQTVSITGMQAQNFVFGGASDVPAPFTGRFDLVITYSYSTSPTNNRTVTRIATVKTAPLAWAAGNPLARNPIQCSSGAGVGFGFDIPTYLHRHGAETKVGDLVLNPSGAAIPANLEVIGTTTISSHYFEVSDRRLKSNFSTIEVPFEKIDKVSGYSFTWKNSGRHDHGFIAQEVEAEFPELVETDPIKNTKKLRYGTLVPILAESSRSLKENSKHLDSRIELLEKKLEKKLKNQKR